MLMSWVLSLQPDEPTPAAPNLGREAHAWFLAQVRAADPALAEALHEGQGLRPFTVSDLEGRLPGGAPGPAPLRPDRTYTLRVTTFSPAISAVLRERILPRPPQAVALGEARLRVAGSTVDPAEHPWAASATFEELVQHFTLQPASPRLVGLRLASPTAFRVTGKKSVLPVPLPGLVFGGLLDKWNAFSPIQVHPDVRRFADECLAVSSYRLETRRVTFGAEGERGALSGCVGHCRYYVEVPDRYWMGLVHLLAGFSLYAGVGLRTTMGLGQARALEGGR
jgi:CRISPR-associated endoribonuclease Cas6